MDKIKIHVSKFLRNVEELCDSNSNLVSPLMEEMVNRIDRLSRHARFVSDRYDMAGYKNFPKLAKLPKPDIELCDIVEFASSLSILRDEHNYTGSVYVNICEDGKFYVGYTSMRDVNNAVDAAIRRLDAHRDNGGGTYWTYFYPVISCLCAFPGDKDDEDLMTLLVAKCVGSDRVRGGKWASALTIPLMDEMIVDGIKCKLLSKSFQVEHI